MNKELALEQVGRMKPGDSFTLGDCVWELMISPLNFYNTAYGNRKWRLDELAYMRLYFPLESFSIKALEGWVQTTSQTWHYENIHGNGKKDQFYVFEDYETGDFYYGRLYNQKNKEFYFSPDYLTVKEAQDWVDYQIENDFPVFLGN